MGGDTHPLAVLLTTSIHFYLVYVWFLGDLSTEVVGVEVPKLVINFRGVTLREHVTPVGSYNHLVWW